MIRLINAKFKLKLLSLRQQDIRLDNDCEHNAQVSWFGVVKFLSQRVPNFLILMLHMTSSPVLWVHIVLSWFFLVLGLLFMRLFSKEMDYTEADYVRTCVSSCFSLDRILISSNIFMRLSEYNQISRSVLITGYPSYHSTNKELIIKHFEWESNLFSTLLISKIRVIRVD